MSGRGNWIGLLDVASGIRQHLAHGLGLARELDEVMPVVDRPLAESFAWMVHARAVATDDRHRAGADPDHQVEAGPPRPH